MCILSESTPKVCPTSQACASAHHTGPCTPDCHPGPAFFHVDLPPPIRGGHGGAEVTIARSEKAHVARVSRGVVGALRWALPLPHDHAAVPSGSSGVPGAIGLNRAESRIYLNARACLRDVQFALLAPPPLVVHMRHGHRGAFVVAATGLLSVSTAVCPSRW